MFTESLYFGVDTINLSINDIDLELDELYSGLSDNSSYKFDQEIAGYLYLIHFTYTESTKTIKIIDNHIPQATIQRYDMITKSTVFTSRYMVTIHSSQLRYSNKSLYNFLIKKASSINRLDICFDIPVSTKTALRRYTSKLSKGATIYDNDKIETQYIGKKSNCKRHFIRVYDKLLDIQVKKKFAEYLHYFNYQNVTRIEVEMHTKTIKRYGINPEMLYNLKNKELESIFLDLCKNKQNTNFPILEKYSLNYKEFEKINEAPESMTQLKYVKQFEAYARGLIEMGINPAKHLFKIGLIDMPIDSYKIKPNYHESISKKRTRIKAELQLKAIDWI